MKEKQFVVTRCCSLPRGDTGTSVAGEQRDEQTGAPPRLTQGLERAPPRFTAAQNTLLHQKYTQVKDKCAVFGHFVLAD